MISYQVMYNGDNILGHSVGARPVHIRVVLDDYLFVPYFQSQDRCTNLSSLCKKRSD